ncbi:MAG: hypothetical protein R3C44_19935 [Chloroflexota bacterium]
MAVLIAAAALRLYGLDWDGFQHHHPDERYITWVATTIEFPVPGTPEWADALNPAHSTFNPFRWPEEADSEGIVVLQDQPRDFAYGHLPLYLGVLQRDWQSVLARHCFRLFQSSGPFPVIFSMVRGRLNSGI